MILVLAFRKSILLFHPSVWSIYMPMFFYMFMCNRSDAVARLFHPYSNSRLSTTREHGGSSGLGLAIISHIAKLMGGTLEVESVPSQGTTFILVLSLPVASIEDTPKLGYRSTPGNLIENKNNNDSPASATYANRRVNGIVHDSTSTSGNSPGSTSPSHASPPTLAPAASISSLSMNHHDNGNNNSHTNSNSAWHGYVSSSSTTISSSNMNNGIRMRIRTGESIPSSPNSNHFPPRRSPVTISSLKALPVNERSSGGGVVGDDAESPNGVSPLSVSSSSSSSSSSLSNSNGNGNDSNGMRAAAFRFSPGLSSRALSGMAALASSSSSSPTSSGNVASLVSSSPTSTTVMIMDRTPNHMDNISPTHPLELNDTNTVTLVDDDSSHKHNSNNDDITTVPLTLPTPRSTTAPITVATTIPHNESSISPLRRLRQLDSTCNNACRHQPSPSPSPSPSPPLLQPLQRTHQQSSPKSTSPRSPLRILTSTGNGIGHHRSASNIYNHTGNGNPKHHTALPSPLMTATRIRRKTSGFARAPAATAGQAHGMNGANHLTNQKRFRVRILLVEDNLVNQKLFVRMLSQTEDWHVDVDVANNGQEAIDMIVQRSQQLAATAATTAAGTTTPVAASATTTSTTPPSPTSGNDIMSFTRKRSRSSSPSATARLFIKSDAKLSPTAHRRLQSNPIPSPKRLRLTSSSSVSVPVATESSTTSSSSSPSTLSSLPGSLPCPYPLVLMDLNMPIVDGYEATAGIRARGYTMPIVALTANALLTERAKALSSGFQGFITKPFRKAHIVGLLNQYASPASTMTSSPSSNRSNSPVATTLMTSTSSSAFTSISSSSSNNNDTVTTPATLPSMNKPNNTNGSKGVTVPGANTIG
jgi:CheY-like chemotaxis protein